MFGASYFGASYFGGNLSSGGYGHFIKKSLIYRTTRQILSTLTKSLSYRVTTNYNNYKYVPQGTVYPKAKY